MFSLAHRQDSGSGLAISRNRLCAALALSLALAVIAGGAGAAGAATKSTSFRVSAIVVGTCMVIPTPPVKADGKNDWRVCSRPPRQAWTFVPVPPPTVTYRRNPGSGLIWETVEF